MRWLFGRVHVVTTHRITKKSTYTHAHQRMYTQQPQAYKRAAAAGITTTTTIKARCEPYLFHQKNRFHLHTHFVVNILIRRLSQEKPRNRRIIDWMNSSN